MARQWVRKEIRDAQTEPRQVAFNPRRMLDDPTLSHDARTQVEDQLFDLLEGLKQLEQAEQNVEESITTISQLHSQMRSNENTEAIIGMIVGLVLFIFFVFMLLQ